MSATQGMQAARRRPIPGMASNSIVAPSERPVADPPPAPPAPAARPARTREKPSRDESAVRRITRDAARELSAPGRPTRSLPTLVSDAEEGHPRLRKASLTELVIALLEEGPQTADEVAEMIRRKRLAEHEER